MEKEIEGLYQGVERHISEFWSKQVKVKRTSDGSLVISPIKTETDGDADATKPA